MKQHKCFKKANEMLQHHNTRLVVNAFDPNQLVVATDRIENLRDGKRAAVVVAMFCPFCGEMPKEDQ